MGALRWGHRAGRPPRKQQGEPLFQGRHSWRSVRTMAADYYSVLGVPRDASKQNIKGAYRRLARKVLPHAPAPAPDRVSLILPLTPLTFPVMTETAFELPAASVGAGKLLQAHGTVGNLVRALQPISGVLPYR